MTEKVSTRDGIGVLASIPAARMSCFIIVSYLCLLNISRIASGSSGCMAVVAAIMLKTNNLILFMGAKLRRNPQTDVTRFTDSLTNFTELHNLILQSHSAHSALTIVGRQHLGRSHASRVQWNLLQLQRRSQVSHPFGCKGTKSF